MKELKLDFTPKFSSRMEFYSRKGISGTFAASGGSTGMFQGEKRQNQYKGKGLIFDGFREYTTSDDARMIDWNASLRANKKLVRKFSEEKNKNIVFFFDVSSSMSYSSHKKLKNEYAAELIASLAYSYLHTGDSVGLVMFTDHLVLRRDFSVGETFWFTLCRDMSNPAYYEGPFNFSRALTEIMSFLKGEAVIFLVSDLIGLEKEEEWRKPFEILMARFELITLMIRDPFDNFIPKGMGSVILQNPFGGEKWLVDMEAVRGDYNKRNSDFIKTTKDFVEKLGGDFLMLTTDKDFQQPVMNFLIWREQVWR